MNATAGTGNVAINVTNATLQGNNTGGDISATTGSGNIAVMATTSSIGTNASRVKNGVLATTATGGINIDTTSSPIDAQTAGINAQVTAGGSGGITIVAGAITANNGTGIISNILPAAPATRRSP